MKKIIFGSIFTLLIVVGVGAAIYKLMNARSFQLMGEIISQINTNEKVVALTFDDGPTEKTEEILEVLEKSDIKATFFLNGKNIKENMERTQKIADAGHEIGNHTYSHQRMVFKSPSFIKREIEDTDQLIRDAGYKGEIHFRPPNGKKLFGLPFYLSQNNRKTIMWNIEPDSYPNIAADSEKIIELVNNEIEPGSIILLHVMYGNEKQKSLESIEGIVKTLKERGYIFKTVSEIIAY